MLIVSAYRRAPFKLLESVQKMAPKSRLGVGWRASLLSSRFIRKTRQNMISWSCQKRAERPLGMRKCIKNALLEKNIWIREGNNEYTPIFVICAVIARNHGKLAGLVHLQMWSDSDIFVRFYFISADHLPPNHARSSLGRGCILVESWSELANVKKTSNLAWIIQQIKLCTSGHASCFNAYHEAPLSTGAGSHVV